MADYFEERGVDTSVEEDREELLRQNVIRLLADFNLFSELGVSHEIPPPASKKAIEELPEEKIEANGGQCQICLKEYEKDEVIKKMPCKHEFHLDCILAWLAKTNSCPLCRYELPTDDQIYEAYRKEKIRAKARAVDIDNLHSSMFT